jgi:hypothetical protein
VATFLFIHFLYAMFLLSFFSCPLVCKRYFDTFEFTHNFGTIFFNRTLHTWQMGGVCHWCFARTGIILVETVLFLFGST